MKYSLYLLFLLSACKGDVTCHTISHYDQRQKIFKDCLTAQTQPIQNHEDDNGHYVEACDSASYHVTNETICETEK